MGSQDLNIIPITKARGQLGDLADQATSDNYFVLTKSGSPTVALVDFLYLKKLEAIAKKLYSKTYIDPNFERFTREFTESEINKWLNEDQL